MFKKRKAADQAKIQEWLDLQDTTLKNIDDEFTRIEALEDAAEKIVKLQELQDLLSEGQNDVDGELETFKGRKTTKKARKVAAGAGIGVTAAYAVPTLILAPAMITMAPLFLLVGAAYGGMLATDAKLKKELLEKQAAFKNKIEDRRQRAEDLMLTTAKNADPKVVAASPYFAEAYTSYRPLSERFAAAVTPAAAEETAAPAAVKNATPQTPKL